ncbi:hypothetical protein NHX12_030314 [Muraenolepis orangiensis]|uniref:Uncharacterized protein n=1 Tax=Muraenolepis orangiensis TaxID=630683 RepID=A0A9Q0IJA3_9TELE|nr:hypothetical protein NHX12_030314 [Muraenolepis orangiensis]
MREENDRRGGRRGWSEGRLKTAVTTPNLPPTVSLPRRRRRRACYRLSEGLLSSLRGPAIVSQRACYRLSEGLLSSLRGPAIVSEGRWGP